MKENTMKAPSKKQICAAVKAKTGVDVELEKHEGSYYWFDPLGKPEQMIVINFEEQCTHYSNLGCVSLDRWVADFEDKYKAFLDSRI